jgi:hypothetical protein
MPDRLLDRIAEQNGAVWLLVIVAALFPTELGSAHVGDSAVASAVAAVLAAGAAALVVLARRPPAGVVLVAAGLSTAGAAAVHFAVTQEHVREWWGYGAFFFVSAWAQLLWAALVVRVHSRGLVTVGLVGNAAVVVLWVVTRTVGLPFGPEPGDAEVVGRADVIATALEVVAALCCLAVLVRPLGVLRIHVPPLLVAAATASLTTVALLAAAGGEHGH